MDTSPHDVPRQPSATIRMDVRLDTLASAKVVELAAAFHRSRAAVLRGIMRWGLNRRHALKSATPCHAPYSICLSQWTVLSISRCLRLRGRQAWTSPPG